MKRYYYLIKLQQNYNAGKNSIYGVHANTARDFQAKVREDPLLVFRKQEQSSLEAIMNNPLRVKELKEKGRRTKKRVSQSRTISRSPPSARNSRSISPHYRRGRNTFDQHRSRGESPSLRARSPCRNEREKLVKTNDSYRHSRDRSYFGFDDRNGYITRDPKSQSQNDRQKELEKRTKEMEQNAKEWNQERKDRVEKEQDRERNEFEKDNEARSKRSDLNSFASDLHRKIYANTSVSEVIQRNKAYSKVR
jgi:hypothetical protein